MISLKNLLIFGAVAFLIILLGFDFLKPVFEIGLTPEDREFILRYKLLGPNPFSKIFEVWSQRGAYSTIPIYYIGIVESFTGFNYPLIQLISVTFRTLAILSIFPLVALIFKNVWLAVLTTIVVAFSYTTTGALETGVEPSEYLGFLLMNIFVIVYYCFNTRYLLKFGWLIVTSLLLFIAVIMSVMRIYPLLFLLPAVEILLWRSSPQKFKFKYLGMKLFILYLPFLILNYYFPTSLSAHFSLPEIISKIVDGNWHLILTPLQGLGYMIPVSKYYDKLGILSMESFSGYFTFLMGGPLVIFGVSSLILSYVSAKKKLAFFLRVFIFNIFLEILTYGIVRYQLDFDLSRIYQTMFGWFLVSLSVNYFIDWLADKQNNLLLSLWLGPSVSLFYITATYFFASVDLSFGGAQDHYLLIPSLGIALFISAVLLLLYNKSSHLWLKATLAGIIISVLVIWYGLNKKLTHNYFNLANLNGRAAAGQEILQTKIKQKLKDFDYSKPSIVYFDTSQIPDGKGPYYSEGLLTPFPTLMFLKGDQVVDGCIGVIYENSNRLKLKKLVHPAVCVDRGKISVQDIAIKPENLYAFKIKDDDFIDIKMQVLQELYLK